MRRVPYVAVINYEGVYICPHCMKIIPREMYKLQDTCPFCDTILNRYSVNMMKWYREQDEDFYKYFVKNNRRKK